MLISLNIGLRDVPGANPEDFLAKVRAAARHKFASVWWPQPSPGDGISPWDTLTSLAVIGSHVPGIGLGTAVVSSHLQHPLVLAARALTVQAATGNRLTLGIGSGHQHTVETVYGIAYDGSAPRLREYLEALMSALGRKLTEPAGTSSDARSEALNIPGASPPAVVLAAHGPAMLKLAGSLADGVITAWAGARALSEHIVPAVQAAAAGAQRPKPRIIAMLPVCVTATPDDARTALARRYQAVPTRPGYRRTLRNEGTREVTDVMLVGDETTVTAKLDELEQCGVTELIALPDGTPDERHQTLDLLSQITAR